jgi:protein-disulfide isomerase
VTKLALVTVIPVVLLVAACKPDTHNLERKVDQIAQDQRKIMDMLARGGAGAGAAQARPPRPEPQAGKTYSVPIDNDPFDGPADAKVTIVKAYDYACPYCEKVRGTMEDLRKKYGNDLRVVSKQLVVHPKNAMAAALAFCAAAKQGKHKEMDRLIWDKGFNARQMDNSDVAPAEAGAQPQKCWDLPDGCKNVVGYAEELQLDVPKFKADMKACQGHIAKDGKDFQPLMVNATPSFFVNGRYVTGGFSIESFSKVIDEELEKANERIAQGTPAAAYYQTWVVERGLKAVELPK